MDNSQIDNNSYLDMLNGGSVDMNWGGTQDFSPVGDQMYTPTQDGSSAEKTKSKKGGNKGKNWSTHEDELLIEAWANTGLNAVIGTDQHSDCYWARITEYYNNHKEPSWPVRPQSSVNSRYTTISSLTSKICGCLQQIINRNQSGRIIQEKRDEAHLLYIELDPKNKPYISHALLFEVFSIPKVGDKRTRSFSEKTKEESQMQLQVQPPTMKTSGYPLLLLNEMKDLLVPSTRKNVYGEVKLMFLMVVLASYH